MDLINNNDDDRFSEARRLYARLRSLGHGHAHAIATGLAQICLMKGTSKLIRYKQDPPEDVETISVDTLDNSEGPFLHDDILLPWWEQFAEALSSVAACEQGYIHLSFRQVQLGEAVSDMLLQSFKTAPLKSLVLMKNGLGSDGMRFVVNAVKMNATLEFLIIYDNHIESEDDATSLVQAVKKHRRFTALILRKCGLGQNDAVMSAIVPSLNHLEQVSLADNCIGSYGARLISNCLASNPDLNVLHLRDNLLNDDDAIMLAGSLKTNTKLRKLVLKGNRITQVGISVLHMSVFNVSSLNTVYDSNHTCFLDLGEEEPLQINCLDDSIYNRKAKMLRALVRTHNADSTNIVYLDNNPIKIMPRVLAFLQGKEIMDASKNNGLNAVFMFMRDWNMPLLYTSHIDPELRRSERIRKKMRMYYMGK